MTARRRRLKDPLRYERGRWDVGTEWVAGVDEVERGTLAGPVVAAAVILPADVQVRGASDSKALSPKARLEVEAEVRSVAMALGLSAAAVDLLGITAATRAALKHALDALSLRPGHVVLDGLPMRGLGWEHCAVAKADYPGPLSGASERAWWPKCVATV